MRVLVFSLSAYYPCDKLKVRLPFPCSLLEQGLLCFCLCLLWQRDCWWIVWSSMMCVRDAKGCYVCRFRNWWRWVCVSGTHRWGDTPRTPTRLITQAASGHHQQSTHTALSRFTSTWTFVRYPGVPFHNWHLCLGPNPTHLPHRLLMQLSACCKHTALTLSSHWYPALNTSIDSLPVWDLWQDLRPHSQTHYPISQHQTRGLWPKTHSSHQLWATHSPQYLRLIFICTLFTAVVG